MERERNILANQETPRNYNPLADEVGRIIEREGGKISFDVLMEAWLYGVTTDEGIYIPGFYTSEDIHIGGRRQTSKEEIDFYTGSERTPLYGMCIAELILDLWEALGKPNPFTIVEMGAGNGTLAEDLLAGIIHQDFYKRGSDEKKLKPLYIPRKEKLTLFENIHYVIIEKSPGLIKIQKENLNDFSSKVSIVHGSATHLPLTDIEGLFLSDELADSFASRAMRKTERGWEELYVSVGDESNFEFFWEEPSLEAAEFLEVFKPEVKIGATYAVNYQAVVWMKQMANSLKKGYILTLDYWCSKENKVFPVHYISSERKNISGSRIEVCSNKSLMGKCDLTVGADFQVLATAGENFGLVNRGFVDTSGFFFGLCADLHYQAGMEKFARRSAVTQLDSNDLYESYLHNFNALLQSKTNENKSFWPFRHTYNPDARFPKEIYDSFPPIFSKDRKPVPPFRG